MAKTVAQKNRAVRQEALRDQLSNQKHVEHVIDIAKKLAEPENKLDAAMITRYKIVIDTKLSLIKKYLPDLKSIEISGELGIPQVVIKDLSGEGETIDGDSEEVING